jgi:hypothetical protein
LKVEGKNVILSRHVTYEEEENGAKINCMKFEKYTISKGDLGQTSCGRRLLKDWEHRQTEQLKKSVQAEETEQLKKSVEATIEETEQLKKSVQVTIEENIEE